MSVSLYAIMAILCLQTLSSCVISNIGQYIYSFYLQTYSFTSNNTPNLTNNTVQSSVNGLNGSNQDSGQCLINVLNDVDAWAQQQSADLFSKIGLWRSVPMIIMTCILGLYASEIGRRFILILTMLGISIQLLIWLSIIYFQLQGYWWYVAAVVLGLTGGDGVLRKTFCRLYRSIF
jgi:MFS family permease